MLPPLACYVEEQLESYLYANYARLYRLRYKCGVVHNGFVYRLIVKASEHQYAVEKHLKNKMGVIKKLCRGRTGICNYSLLQFSSIL